MEEALIKAWLAEWAKTNLGIGQNTQSIKIVINSIVTTTNDFESIFFWNKDIIKPLILSDDCEISSPNTSIPCTESWITKEIIFNPLNNQNLIKQRQEIISFLLSDSISLEEFIRNKNRGYALGESLEHIFERPDKEWRREILGSIYHHYKELWIEFNREKILEDLEENRYNKLEIFIKYQKWSDTEIISRIELIKNEWFSGVFERTLWDLVNIADIKINLTIFGTFLKEIKHPVFLGLWYKLDNIISDWVDRWCFPTIEELVTAIRSWDKKRFDIIKALSKELSEFTSKIWAILWFANLVKRDSYSPVQNLGLKNVKQTYDNGWSFARQKCKNDRDKKTKDQVRNWLKKDHDVTVLSWSNMSWKSFFLLQNFYMQLLAQSFWYVPAENPSFRVFDKIVFVDRASTDSFHNLSAFWKEIENWKKILDWDVSNMILLSDEAFSTTSAEDQAILLEKTWDHITRSWGKIVLANHNDAYMRSKAWQDSFGFYHFDTGFKSNWDIDFYHTIKEWIDESKSFEVAHRMWFPKDALESAIRYMKWESVEITEIQKHLWVLERYTEVERNKQKSETRSFMRLMPWGDEIIKNENWGHRSHNLYWRYTIDHTERDDYWNNRWWRKVEKRPEFTSPFTLLSEDRDFHNWFNPGNFSWLHSWESTRYIQQILLHYSSSDSKEIFERQNMFEEISKEWADQKLEAILWQIYEFIFWMNFRYDEKFYKSFNRIIIGWLYAELNEWHNVLDRSWVILSFIWMIKWVMKLLNSEINDFDIEKIEKEIISFYKLIKDLRVHEEKGRDEVHKLYKREDWDREAYWWNHKEKRLNIINESWISFVNAEMDEDEIKKILYKKIKEYATETHSRATDLLIPLSITDFETEKIQEAFKDAFEYAKTVDWYSWIWIKEIWHIMSLTNKWNPIKDFENYLKSFDSVHLHQIANYFDNVFWMLFWDIRSWIDFFEKLKTQINSKASEKIKDDEDEEIFSVSRRSKWFDFLPHYSFEDRDKLYHEFRKLFSLFTFARLIREHGYAKVNFSGNWKLDLTNAWSMTKPKDEQIRNSIIFDENERIKLISWTNMSWKTFYLKQLIWNILCAQATWFCPSDSATMPVFDNIVYLDRVNWKTKEELSAFWNEVEYWKKVFWVWIDSKMNIFAFDETFSTTSAKYQTALTYWVNEDLLKKWQFVAIASHSHDFLRDFNDTNLNKSRTYHFKTHIWEDWQIAFDYEIEDWHAPSQAIAVAKKLWIREDILN
ncbi:MAG: dna mismatch repair protein [uncultured bacterium (gcode 4)]|uniref:Dna mismatch repair protein n=1 Tax=uncultured bacterium (gcode 4) TaxID=1234023 RepID=K2GVE8_9BACT|nr:MAG: dna mismatch repair protein [uncultured bacterium (gcode 4)]